MIVDSLQDPWAEIRSLKGRIRALETASPLENASISRGGIRALIPGNEDGDGATKYGRELDKVGFLLKDDGSWITMQEKIAKELVKEALVTDQKIANSHEYSNNRIGDLEDRTGALEPRMADAEGDIAAVPGLISSSHEYPNARIGDLEGRMGTVEGVASSAKSATDNHGPRITSLESGKAAKSIVDAIVDRVNAIESDMREYHPDKVFYPPLVKG